MCWVKETSKGTITGGISPEESGPLHAGFADGYDSD